MILKVSADTTEVTKGIENVEDSVKGTDAAVGGLTNQLDKMTGGAVTGFRNFAKGVKTGVLGLKTFKVALAATGIGLILVAFGALASYFTSTKRGAEQLKVATAALGAIFDVLRDRVSKMGESLFEAISNPKETIIEIGKLIKENLTNRFEGLLEFIPAVGKAITLAFKGKFSEAGKVAADAAGKMVLGVESVTDVVGKAGEAVAELTEEITKEAQAAKDLEAAQNTLKDQERDFIKQRAETNKLIAESRLLAEDDTLAVGERVKALQKAVDLEQQTTARQLTLAEERARIAREQVALGESSEEDLQRVAEAEAAVIDLQTASLRTQKRLQTELNTAKREEQAAIDADAEAKEKTYQEQLIAKQKLEDELFLLNQTAREREELAVMQAFDRRISLAGDDEELIKQATTAHNDAMKAIDDRHLAEKEASEDASDIRILEAKKARAKAFLDTAKSSLDALSALNEAFSGDSEAQQKKGFERSKKIQIAQALIGTYESATSAFGSLASIPIVGPALGAVAAAGAVVAGLANVKKIKSTTFSGGGGDQSNSYSGIGDTGSGPPTPTAPQLDLGFLGGGAGQDGFRTYVIASEVSNSQQANQKINDQAALVG